MIYFTSDTHFYHENVIRYCNRPFKDRNHMNRALIENWNDTVRPNDELYFIGDLAFCTLDELEELVKKLHGRKSFVTGNHDRIKHVLSERIRPHFERIVSYYELNVRDEDAKNGKQKIILSHYPMLTWNRAHYGSWMLHGHSHGTMRYPFPAKIMDVGVDCNDYRPVSYEQVKKRMASINPAYLDHHKGD